MRVTAVRTVAVNATPHTNWIFVSIETDEGVAGVGEATLIGHERLVADAVEDLGAALLGRDPLQTMPLNPPAQAGHVAAAARSGLEQAVWDIRGKAYGLPVHRLWGGGTPSVPVYANTNRSTRDRSPAGFRLRAEEAVAAGFRAVKCAPFDEYHWWESTGRRDLLEIGFRRVEAVRQAIPVGIALMVDCHWRFDVPTAIEVGNRLAPLGLCWYEAPVAERDTASVREVKDRTGLRIAGGELLTDPAQYRALLEARCVDILMPDVKYAGGIQGLLQVDALAGAFGTRVAPHNPSGPVATAATLQAASVLGALLMVEYQFAEIDWYADLVRADFSLHDGRMKVPTGPGLGVDLDWSLAAKHPCQPVTHLQNPRLFQ